MKFKPSYTNIPLKSKAKRRVPADCAPCQHSAEHGWWGDGAITHCRDCHYTWPLTQTRLQHCVRCHESFGGDEAATRHLDRNGKCRDPREILHKNGRRILEQNDKGVWVRAYGK